MARWMMGGGTEGGARAKDSNHSSHPLHPSASGDLLEVDLGRATVLYLYLLPEGIATLRPRLECVWICG